MFVYDISEQLAARVVSHILQTFLQSPRQCIPCASHGSMKSMCSNIERPWIPYIVHQPSVSWRQSAIHSAHRLRIHFGMYKKKRWCKIIIGQQQQHGQSHNQTTLARIFSLICLFVRIEWIERVWVWVCALFLLLYFFVFIAFAWLFHVPKWNEFDMRRIKTVWQTVMKAKNWKTNNYDDEASEVCVFCICVNETSERAHSNTMGAHLHTHNGLRVPERNSMEPNGCEWN